MLAYLLRLYSCVCVSVHLCVCEDSFYSCKSVVDILGRILLVCFGCCYFSVLKLYKAINESEIQKGKLCRYFTCTYQMFYSAYPRILLPVSQSGNGWLDKGCPVFHSLRHTSILIFTWEVKVL